MLQWISDDHSDFFFVEPICHLEDARLSTADWSGNRHGKVWKFCKVYDMATAWWVFLPHPVLCTTQLMHHYFPGLHLKMALYPIFGPLCGPRAHLLSMFHVYYSYCFYLLISPCLSTILDYMFDSSASPPNGCVTLYVHDSRPQCARDNSKRDGHYTLTCSTYLLCSTLFLSHGRRVSLTYKHSYIAQM